MERESRNLTVEECAQAVILLEEGWSFRRIGQRFGVSHTSISRMIERYRETGQHLRRPGQGRHRITTRVQDRFLRVSAVRQRFVTGRLLQTQLQDAAGLRISTDTVRRRLADSNLRPRIPARGPALTPEHRRARLNFAREHIHWAVEDWERVLWSDESRFCLYNSDRRVRVYRRPNERYAQCNFQNTRLFGGGSVMFWGGISLTARTDLVVINNGSLTADRYIREILQDHVIPFAPYIGENFLFQHDNARPHVAQIVQNYLNEVGIDTMEWPANSPDLNPIENVWDMIYRRFQKLPNPPNNLNGLTEDIVQIWNNLDQNDIRSVMLSMNNRCRAVIQNRGGNTHY